MRVGDKRRLTVPPSMGYAAYALSEYIWGHKSLFSLESFSFVLSQDEFLQNLGSATGCTCWHTCNFLFWLWLILVIPVFAATGRELGRTSHPTHGWCLILNWVESVDNSALALSIPRGKVIYAELIFSCWNLWVELSFDVGGLVLRQDLDKEIETRSTFFITRMEWLIL